MKRLKVIKNPIELDCIIADSLMEQTVYHTRYIKLGGEDAHSRGTDLCELKDGDYIVRERDGWNIYKPEEFYKKFKKC